MTTARPMTNRQFLWPFALPYAAWVILPGLMPEMMGDAGIYGIRIVVTALLLWMWRRRYRFLFSHDRLGNSLGWGVCLGAAGFIAWILLAIPFAGAGSADPWTAAAFWSRLAGAVLVVPMFEEMLMRGFLYRLVLQWRDIVADKVPDTLHHLMDHSSVTTVSGHGSHLWAAGLTTLVFAAGHPIHQWPAAVAYGLVMVAHLVKGGMTGCIVGHAVTNLLLAAFVRMTGWWILW